jgi:hypothetical protein
MSIALNPCMTTRYSGRVERYASSPGWVRQPDRSPDSSKDLLEKPAGATDSSPTPAETLARLLDTHSWLRVRKN